MQIPLRGGERLVPSDLPQHVHRHPGVRYPGPRVSEIVPPQMLIPQPNTSNDEWGWADLLVGRMRASGSTPEGVEGLLPVGRLRLLPHDAAETGSSLVHPSVGKWTVVIAGCDRSIPSGEIRLGVHGGVLCLTGVMRSVLRLRSGSRLKAGRSENSNPVWQGQHSS
jgi:hypothetical protein